MKSEGKPDAVAILGSEALFKGLAGPVLARISASTTVRALARGEALFDAGEPCEGLFVVLQGQLKVFAKSPAGQEKVIEVLGQGQCVGEAPLFSDGVHTLHAAALSDTRLLVVPKAVLLREIEHNAGLAMRMLAGLSRRLNGLVKDIEAVTLQSGVKRVVDYLLHAPPPGDRPATGPDHMVSLPASKGTIASLLSVTPEHFSRILHDLQAQGLIAVDRRHIHILNAQALAMVG